MLLALLNAAQVAQLRFVEWSVYLALEQFGVAKNRLQWSAELMAQEGEEIGLHPIGYFSFFARSALGEKQIVLRQIYRGKLCAARGNPRLELAIQLAKRFLGAYSLGDVAQDPKVPGRFRALVRGASDCNRNSDAFLVARAQNDLPAIEAIEIAEVVKLVTVFPAPGFVEEGCERLAGKESRFRSQQFA